MVHAQWMHRLLIFNRSFYFWLKTNITNNCRKIIQEKMLWQHSESQSNWQVKILHSTKQV